MNVLVTGAGGFIGHHLVSSLKAEGHWVRGVDIKEPEYAPSEADDFCLLDLRELESCLTACQGIKQVYHLAADVGGIGYISFELAHLTRNNVLMDSHMLEASRLSGVSSYLYTSSSCAYPVFRQTDADNTPLLKEEDVMPADPMEGYGWEKLFAERLTTYYGQEFGLDFRIVRFHNIYGPLGTWEGRKAKAVASLCRKVAIAPDGGELEVWGDGKQVRSFCYIDECTEGLTRIMASGYNAPINLGKPGEVTINDLATTICEVAGKNLNRKYDLSMPMGVRARNPDNSRLLSVLGWEPSLSLTQGIGPTYEWVAEQVMSDALVTR